MKKLFTLVFSLLILLQGAILPAAAADESFQFLPGANLFAYPVDPESSLSSANLLASLTSQAAVSSIQRYNSESGLFETCVWKNGEASGADFPILAEEGYIVHTSESFTFTVSGELSCPGITLSPGLNIVPFPCAAVGYTSQQLLQDLGSAAIAVKTQDPADDSILTATRENNVISGDNFPIEHGHSYLVYVESETDWFPIAVPPAPGNAAGYGGEQMAVLTWDSPATTILGYNIYRTATSGSNYEKLNSDLLQQTEYTDQGLANGSNWYYVISAVDQYGRETAFSSEAAVTPSNTGPTVISGGSVISTDTLWSLSASPYTISDSITLSAGVTLTLEPGVVVEFHTGSFTANGKVIAKGTAEHPITFRADDGSWTGLQFDTVGSTGSVLEYCHIEDASTPVRVENSSIEISHCSIFSTSSYGLYYLKSGGHIHHTSISGSYGTMRGMYLNESSPLVEYNTISSPGTGIYMYGDSAPQVLHNTITDFNDYGLDLYGTNSAQPYPTIMNNIIETNRGDSGTYLLHTASYYNAPAAGTHRTVNAQNNYWGTDDPGIICASILQWNGEDDTRPYVDFSHFLDSPDGNSVPGHFIFAGPLPAEELSWTPAQGPYIVLGHALVDSGDELLIAPGTDVQFAGGRDVYGYRRDRFSSLQVLGKLTAVGTAELPVHLSSESTPPEKSDWYGIVFLDNHDSTSIVSYCKIEHAYRGIVCIGGSTTINNNEIIAGNELGKTSAAGIRLEKGNTSSITGNSITGYDYIDSSGIYIRGSSSPTINNNIIEANRNGVYCRANSSLPGFSTAQISSNSILNNTQHSVYLYGSSNDTTNPQPVFNNNVISSPSVTSASFYAGGSYGYASAITINAQNNWWGTYDAAAIAVAVYDRNDNGSSPWVDYRFFLDDTNGSPGTGNQVLGDLAADSSITWSTANSPYIVMGSLNIPSGSTLTIDAGVEIWMSSGGTVNVDGKLIVNGTELNPVLFSAGNMIGTPAEWEGIRLIGSANNDSILSHCHISNAKTALYMEDCNPTISYCNIASSVSSNYTVRLLRSSGIIDHCTIRNLAAANHSTSGIYIENSSPQATYNTISDMHWAIRVLSGGTAQILHNTLSDFTYTGIDLDGYYGDPFPTINFNTIQTSKGDSSTWLIRTSYFLNDPVNGVYQVIDAKNNYWGTADPQQIGSSISQWNGSADDTSHPVVDYSSFLDSPNGSPVSGHFIPPGHITESTWDSASGPCIVLGHSFIANGETLTISPGTEVKFLGGDESIFGTTHHVRSSLRVYGKLTASGTSASAIHFYSNHSKPTEGNWSGIFFYDSADDTSIISYSKIEHAFNSIYCMGAAPEISNNTILAGPGNAYSTSLYGIHLEGGSDAAISNNLINGFSYLGCYGINLLDSSPTISGNTIDGNNYGIYIRDGSPTISDNTIAYNSYGLYIMANSSTAVASTPAITNNAIVDNSSYSVYLYGYSSGDSSTSPQPVFTNNSFATQYSPANSFYTTYYSSSNTITINAENNWWGTAAATEISDIIRDRSDTTGAPSVDFDPFLTASPSYSFLGALNMSTQWLSPNSDGSQDTVTVSWQGSADISNWTVTVKNTSGVAIRTETVGSGLEWIWDGKDDSDAPVADGQYSISITGSNAGGTVEREAGSVTVDTSAVATVQIIAPDEAQVLQNIFDIEVTVLDEHLSAYTLEIGKGASPASWQQLESGSANIEDAAIYTLESNSVDTDTVPSMSSIGDLTDGVYVLRLTATDLAGNSSVVERSINLENVFITDVEITEIIVDLTISQSAVLSFTIDKTADAVLKIYTEDEGQPDQLIREISQPSLAAGTHNFSWDGKNNSGQNVPVGGYVFVLSATTASGTTDLFLPEPTLNIPASWSPIASFNTSANEWFTSDCTMAAVPGRYRITVTPYDDDGYQEAPFTVYTDYYPAGESFLFTWDGRRPDGTLVTNRTSFWCHDTWSNANLFIVRSSSAPKVTGQAPNVNVKSNPFLINFCYGERTSLLYNLDRQAEISITLFPVDEDASSPDAIVLVDHEMQSSGDHTVSWDATDSNDIRHVLFAREGLYAFSIEATAEGITSTSRGVISLYK